MTFNVVGGVDKVFLVDVYVPGCPPKPEAIIDGIVLALDRLKECRPGRNDVPLMEKLRQTREFYANRKMRKLTKTENRPTSIPSSCVCSCLGRITYRPTR